MAQLQMPDGAFVEMPDQLDPQLVERLRQFQQAHGQSVRRRGTREIPDEIRRIMLSKDRDRGYAEWSEDGMRCHDWDPDENGPAFELWHQSSIGGKKYKGRDDLLKHWRTLSTATLFDGPGRSFGHVR